MKKKSILKRCISIQLIMAMTAGLVGSSLTGIFVKPQEVEAAINVEYSKEKNNFNIIPAVVKDNSGVMNKYVRKNGGLNINDGFVLIKDDRCDGDSPLTMSKISHSSDDYGFDGWYHWYYGDLRNVDLYKNGELELNFQAEIIADKHSSFWHHWKKKWDYGKINIGFARNDSPVLGIMKSLKSYSASQNDGGQFISDSWHMGESNGFNGFTILRYQVYNSGCPCGDAGSKNTVFYLVDKVAPRVTGSYISTDKDGNNRVGWGDGFSTAGTTYITLEFSENIRYAGTEADNATLKINYKNAANSQGDASSYITANLVKVYENKMVFSFSRPSGAGTYIYLDEIAKNQDWTNKSYDLALYKGDGSLYTSDCGIDATSMITDLAGNSLNWAGSNRGVDKIYFDTIAPELKKVTMWGSMMKNNTNDDNDPSTVYAGVGDKIKFSVYFSEEIVGYSNVKATLNIKDATTGNYIKVDLDRARSATAKSVYGTDAMDGYITYFDFKQLTITDNMIPDGELIKITAIEGLGSAKDRRGNTLKSFNISSITPQQQETLDNISPVTETTLSKDDGEDIYIPISEGDTIFTIPLIVKDGTQLLDSSGNVVYSLSDANKAKYMSGVSEQGQFSFMMGAESKKFEYCVNTSQNITGNEKWLAGNSTTSSKENKYKLLQLGEGNVVYLHIKLYEGVNYGFNETDGTIFTGTVKVYAKDYAGNQSTKSYTVKHKMDSVAPVIRINSASTLDIDNEGLKSTFTTGFNVSDMYGVKEIKYYWNDDAANAVTLDSEGIMDKSSDYTVSIDTPFEENSNIGRTGTHKLTVLIEDFGGNTATASRSYYFEFLKPNVNYEVKKNGVDNPFTVPEVIIQPATGGVDNTTYTSMALFKVGESAHEQYDYKYYAFILKDDTQGVDIFKGIDTPESYEYADCWYEVYGNAETACDELDSGWNFEINEVTEWIMKQYGTVEMTFVASPEINCNNGVFSYTAAQSDIKNETMYIANDAKFTYVLNDILNDEGVSIRGNLINGADGVNYMHTVPTLDNASIDISIYNANDETSDIDFGFAAFDSSKSYIELYKSGETETPIYTWPLSATQNQSLVIPEGIVDTSTAYWLELVLCDIEGNTYSYEVGEYYDVDLRTNDIVLDSYFKTYAYVPGTAEDYTNRTIYARQDANLSSGEEYTDFTVALNEVPVDWTCDPLVREEGKHQIGFYYKRAKYMYDIVENTTIKIYNAADENGEDNAIIVDGEDDYNIYYTPVLVEDFDENSYGTSDAKGLPLKAGDNTIVFEIVNTNGTITKKTMNIYAETKACEFEIKSDKTILREIITPEYDITIADRDIEFRDFNKAPSDSYTYTSEGEKVFYAYDTVGTMYVVDYDIVDVDGDAPWHLYVSDSSWSDYYSGHNLFIMYVNVTDNGLMSIDDLSITFDEEYSKLLLGLTDEDVAAAKEADSSYVPSVTIDVPVCLEKDENGDYIPWEAYDTKNYGIYRTEVSEVIEDAEDGGWSTYSLEIYGTFKYDPSIPENTYAERTMYVTATDRNGNGRTESYTIDNIPNKKPELRIGGKDENGKFSYDHDFDTDGSMGVYSENIPITKILSYGGTEIEYHYNDWNNFNYFYSTLPMINADGIYDITFTDLFGQDFTQELYVNLFGTTDIQFEYSETEYTNNDVTVSAKTLLDGDAIVSITGVAGNQNVVGTIGEDDATQASIIMPANGTVTVTTALGKTHTVRVVNIDKVIEPVTYVMSYVDAYEPEFEEGSEDTILNEVTFTIKCDEDIEGVNGPLEYTFKKGVAKGSTYTFEYVDVAGNVGSTTVTLPYNILPEQVPEVDEEAPEYEINLYAMRNNTYKYVASGSQQADATGLGTALQEYVAQAYALEFVIDDVNVVKVIVKAKGAAAPTSYFDSSDEIDGVKVVGDYIYITKNNVEFDVYLIDAVDNVTSYKGVNITSIDLEAPLVTINKTAKKNDNGDNYVQAEYVVDNGEFIISLDPDAYSMFDEETYEDEFFGTGNDITYYYHRYYKDIYENGENQFVYKDIYGNKGVAVIDIQGIDNVAPIVLSTKWYGTTANGLPSNSNMVNNDITAVMAISKVVNKVNLYYYDETANNHIGAPVGEDADVYATFNGTRVSLTYTDNCDKTIVAEIFASSGGKTVYKEFAPISCIDKIAPVVNMTNATLSDDKLSKEIVFISDEDTVVMEDNSAYKNAFSKEHTLTFVDCGEYVVEFTDKAGNVTEYTFTINDIDDKVIDLKYSVSDDGSNNTDEPLDLDLSLGDTIYIMSNKDANVDVDGVTKYVEMNVWNEFVLSNESGFCLVKAEDLSTGKIISENLSVKIKDMQAPRINFTTNTICVNESMSLDMINVLIKNGVSVSDDRDGDITEYNVSGMPLAVSEGLYVITYSAIDKAGNVGTNIRTLYICGENTPLISVNGETAIPYGTTVVNGLTINFEVFQIDEPVVVKWKAGKKTTGQMKKGANLAMGSTFEVPEEGFYTIYIRTQSRQEIVTYIYVEE